MAFPSTDLPSLKERDDTEAVRKSVLDLLDKINTVSTSLDSLTSTVNSISSVYDTGSNANGSWIRWNNGVMQCWGISPVIVNSTTGTTQTFPQVFSSVPSVVYMGTSTRGATAEAGSTAPSATVSSFNIAHGYAASQSVSWQALGRWK